VFIRRQERRFLLRRCYRAPVAQPARLPAARRRRQLLDVAQEVFAEQGFHATSMDEVAEAAGITKPVLYQHFDSKRQLYRELLDDVGQQLLAAIAEATAAAAGQPRHQVEAGFGAYFRFVDQRRSAFRLLFGSGARRDEEFADAVRNVEAAIAEAIAALIEADIDSEHRLLLANGIVGLAEGTGRYWLAGGLDLDPDVVASRIADLAWAGLRAVHR
jgi:AcrR family transcriptional regulator